MIPIDDVTAVIWPDPSPFDDWWATVMSVAT